MNSNALFESFADGLVVLSLEGDVLCANTQAREICRHLTHVRAQFSGVGQEVWSLLQAVMRVDPCVLDSTPVVVVEGEYTVKALVPIRIRVERIQTGDDPCWLIILEDQQAGLQKMAIAEARTWGLTQRETELWLLRRSGWSYGEIAHRLCISLDTVKKHLKNIYAKRQGFVVD